MVVGCLSVSYPDVLSSRNLQSSSKPSFTSQDAFIFLQKCSSFRQLKQIHGRIIRNGFYDCELIATRLLRLCSSYGKLDYATFVFLQIDEPTTFAWNLLIRTYTVNGCSHRAILSYNLMVCDGVRLDKFTFPFVMKACLDCCYVEKAKEIYGLAIKTGFSGDVYLDNVLIDLYFKCGVLNDGMKVFHKMRGKNVVSWTTVVAGLTCTGRMDSAQQLFDKMPIRNVVSWTAMINGYAKIKKPEKAFELFSRMQGDNVSPNEHTLVGLLGASTELGSLKLGSWVHDFAIQNGFEIGPFLGTALVDMYSKCGSLEHAKRVFESMEDKSVATWNTMITSLGVHGRGHEAIALFGEMERMNVEPDGITFVGILCACLLINDLDKGREYFVYMTERYGITPSTEHYTCLSEIYSRVAQMAGFSIIKSDPLVL